MRLVITRLGLYDETIENHAEVGDPKGTVTFEGCGCTFSYDGDGKGLNLKRCRKSVLWNIATDLRKEGRVPGELDLADLCNRAFRTYDGNTESSAAPAQGVLFATA